MSTGRPPYNLFRVVVERVRLITPHMKRITIDGSCLPGFDFALPAQWLKIFVPAVDGRDTVSRAYTVRDFDPASKRLDLDFVLHGDDGPASAWAARVNVGDSSIHQHALMEWGVDRKRLHAAGYWKSGEPDHRDEEGFV